VEVASTLFGSELTFIKPILELKRYIQLPLGTVLAGRVRLETIFDAENNEDIPIFKRLFLGGANTVRGYGYQEMGPLDETGHPMGGQSSALANIELRHPIVGIVSGVLFLDMGMVDEEKLHYNGDELRTSAGAGLRMDTPLGPLRLDFGYQLNPPKFMGDDETVPVEETSRWRIHFNIGHAF
jgi:outer membrane protein insertion porin family/translocation and assembly module TamA